MSETWLIEPRDALIARDGKPFSAVVAGARASSLDFPFPSTTTGGARTRAGLNSINGDASKFTKSLGDEVQREIEVRGALLAEIGDNKVEFLVFAPADCLIVKPEDDNDKNRFPLVPIEDNGSTEFYSNLPDNLKLLGTAETDGATNQTKLVQVKGKPQSERRFWRWSEFEQWLIGATADKIDAMKFGHNGIEKDQRTHVRIRDENNVVNPYQTKANSEGGIFQTRGLEFTKRHDNLEDCKKLALAVAVDYNAFAGRIDEGIAPLGGERRIVAWRKSRIDFPKCPQQIREAIKTHKACRLILLTPAIFKDGHLPDWSKTENNLKVTVEAIAVNRYQTISGWDFKGKILNGKWTQCPKPTRRMCAAGTVLFLKLDGKNIEEWIDATWMRNVSDDEQDRKDGFGLAALGVWDGKNLKVEEMANA